MKSEELVRARLQQLQAFQRQAQNSTPGLATTLILCAVDNSIKALEFTLEGREKADSVGINNLESVSHE